MNTLDFISIDKAERSDRFHPVLKSPMHRRLAEAGAVFEERDGWLVASHVPGQDRHRIAIRDVTASYRVEEGDGSVNIEFEEGEHGVRPPTGEGQTLVASYRGGAGGPRRLPEYERCVGRGRGRRARGEHGHAPAHRARS